MIFICQFYTLKCHFDKMTDEYSEYLYVHCTYLQCIKYHLQSNNCRRLNGRMTFQWMPAVVQHHWCWISFDAAKHLQLWTRQVMHNLVLISMKALLGFWWLQEIRTFIFIFKQPQIESKRTMLRLTKFAEKKSFERSVKR